MKSSLKDEMRKEFADILKSDKGRKELKSRGLDFANVIYVFDQLIECMDEENATTIFQKRIIDRLNSQE